jgi:hypothetical protein
MDDSIIGPRDLNVVRTPQAAMPTLVTYTALQQAFDHFKRTLLDDRSPPCLITLQRKGRAQGYYSPDKFASMDGESKLDEMALNPKYFRAQSVREICSTLVHEMVHQVQHHFGKPTRPGYHDRKWGEAMKAIGLWPSGTGKPGGRETGYHMSHYIIEGGPFAVAFEALDATIEWGDTLTQEEAAKPKAKRLKFTCPLCGFNVLAVPSGEGRIGCFTCGNIAMAAAV